MSVTTMLNDLEIHLDVSMLDDLNSRTLPCVNDLGGTVTVYKNRLEIKFSDEEKPRVFHTDTLALYHKIIKFKEVCYDDHGKLKFELDWLLGSKFHTVRIVILEPKSDNFRVEVSRSELLASLAFYHF